MTEAPEARLDGLAEATDFIRSHRSFAVISHVNPDADSVGALLGLTRGLRSLGKEAAAVLTDAVPEYARFLKGSDQIQSQLPADSVDAFVFADSADIDRVGSLYEEHKARFDRGPILNLDHHRTNPGYGTVNLVDGEASSTSELVWRLLSNLNAGIDEALTTALLFGIVGDTGSFQNGATTPGSLEAAARLVANGADFQLVAFQLFERKTFAATRLWGQVLSTIELDVQRRIVFASLSQQTLKESGALPDEAEGIVEHLRGIVEADVVVLLKENDEGNMRVSMRSRPRILPHSVPAPGTLQAIDVSEIATALGGGGHLQAAGCTIDGPFPVAKQTIADAFDRVNPHLRPAGAESLPAPSGD